MAKKSNDSKIAVAGALTLVLAFAGILLVKEPLRSSRPFGTGLDMRVTTEDQTVRARLWEDPVAAVQRGLREAKTKPPASTPIPPLTQRLRPIRQAIADRVKDGQHVTVLLVTTSGG